MCFTTYNLVMVGWWLYCFVSCTPYSIVQYYVYIYININRMGVAFGGGIVVGLIIYTIYYVCMWIIYIIYYNM